jgi:hypothetical protein
MALQDRFDALEPRERRLVMLLGIVFVGVLLLLVPVGVAALLSDSTETHTRLREAIDRLEAEGDAFRERQAEKEAIKARYETPTPALAGFLDKAASASGMLIPEIKDQSPVVHGKRYEERSTAISFREVGLLALVKFMERIAGGVDPISITKLNVRKRGGQPDKYDVQMTVSAYHRLQTKDDKPKEDRDPKAKAEEETP